MRRQRAHRFSPSLTRHSYLTLRNASHKKKAAMAAAALGSARRPASPLYVSSCGAALMRRSRGAMAVSAARAAVVPVLPVQIPAGARALSSDLFPESRRSKKETGTGHRPTKPRRLSHEARQELQKKKWSRQGLKPTPDKNLPKIERPFAAALEGVPADRVRVTAAVVVERLPIVAPDFPDWKADWLQQKMETEQELKAAQTKLADEYVQQQEELHQKKRKKAKSKKGAKKESADDDSAAEDASATEETFQEQQEKSFPKITLEDEADNRKSLYRKLDQRLYLIVKKDRTSNAWQFPQATHADEDGDALRNTAERCARESLGDDLEKYFLGHGPMTWYAYKLADGDAADAAQVFYFKSQFLAGQIALGAGLVDYLWVTRDELKEYIQPEEFLTHLDQALLD
jgi:large subunit ribosomal protein L46